MRGTVDRARRGLWASGPPPFGFYRLILDGTTPKRIVRCLDDGSQIVLDAESDTVPKGKSHKKQDHEVCTLIPALPERLRAIRRMFANYAACLPTLKERRALIACYLHSIKADPDSQEVRIGLYPVVLSQIIAGAGLEPSDSGL